MALSPVVPDLIGMGDSEKLPNPGPGSYTFVEHRRYLDGILEALGVRIDLVHVVAPGALPRTTSGKVRRTEVARMEHLGV